MHLLNLNSPWSLSPELINVILIKIFLKHFNTSSFPQLELNHGVNPVTWVFNLLQGLHRLLRVIAIEDADFGD